MNEKFKKMTFGDYMNGLSTEKVSEKGAMIQRVMDACMVSEVVVYNWMAGRTSPDLLKKKVISGLLNRPVEELFPQK